MEVAEEERGGLNRGREAAPESEKRGGLKRGREQAQRLVIGGVAGCLAKTTVAPLERLRIMAQTGHASGGMVSMWRLVVRDEGVSGLWRGNFVNCMRVFPSRGVLFSCNDLFKGALVSWWYPTGSTLADGRVWTNGSAGATHPPSPLPLSQPLPMWMSFAAGSSAGMLACVLTYPLDVARTRMSGRLVKPGGADTRVVAVLTNMARREGPMSWYRGVGPTLAGSVPYEGIKFASFDWAMDALGTVNPNHAVLNKLMSGAVGGATAGVFTFPNDTVRKLMQMQGRGGEPLIYSSAWDCWIKTYREGGLPRFYRGITAYLLRMAPNSAVQFGAYSYLKDFLERAE